MAVPLKFAIPFLATLGLCIGASCGYAVLYAIAVATPAVAQPPYHSDWYSPGYGEHRRWSPEERYDRMLERERIERERAAERERHRIRCAHNPYHPDCYR